MITTVKTQRSKALHITLWAAQIVLAAMFLMAGYMKTFTPIDQLTAIIPWAGEAKALVRFIGASELLGGVGLILPAVLRVKPQLTVWAAAALALVMALAILFHIFRGEFAALGSNIVLLVLAAFVAWGRSGKAPIHPKDQNE